MSGEAAKVTKGRSAETPVAAGSDEAPADPRQLFWSAGAEFQRALQRSYEEAWHSAASAARETQMSGGRAQVVAQQRAEELRNAYVEALQGAQGAADFNERGTAAAQKYHEAPAKVHAEHQKLAQNILHEGQQQVLRIQAAYKQACFAAFVDYKVACQKAWASIDVAQLPCESLAFIGQSIALGAQLVGGTPR